MKRFLLKKASCGLLLIIAAASSATAAPWKFGVISDAQWIGTDDGRNPEHRSVDIIKALNQQFINKGVQVRRSGRRPGGQTGSTAASTQAEDIRAAFAQELYNAGIGFFPFRGNHDSQPLAGTEFKRIYPQTLSGIMNSTPADVFSVPNPDAAVQPFPTVTGGRPSYHGHKLQHPRPSDTGGLDWTGLSYSFDYNNARFVMLDQFSPLNARPNQNPAPNAIELQQPWINTVLSGKPSGRPCLRLQPQGADHREPR